jgi:2,3-bisphosphoglycerate-independent phosphoglycerate mutase
MNKPFVLIILDGWGVAPPSKGNAITLANTPNIDGFLKKYISAPDGLSNRIRNTSAKRLNRENFLKILL